jgi:hypothetical protein
MATWEKQKDAEKASMWRHKKSRSKDYTSNDLPFFIYKTFGSIEKGRPVMPRRAAPYGISNWRK